MELRIGVLALQGDVREHVRALAAAGAVAVPVRRPAELAAVDAIVLPGGESTTNIKLARTFDLLEPLRQRLRAGMPASVAEEQIFQRRLANRHVKHRWRQQRKDWRLLRSRAGNADAVGIKRDVDLGQVRQQAGRHCPMSRPQLHLNG